MWGKTAERSMTLYELLGKMQPRARQDVFEFAEFWDVMEKRGFGPMLALPSFIACTPIGAIPGIPSLAGGTILLIALQILLGRRHPWLPQKVTMRCRSASLYGRKSEALCSKSRSFFSASLLFYAATCISLAYCIVLCGMWFRHGSS